MHEMQRLAITMFILLVSTIASAQQQYVAIPVSCHSCGGERFHHSHCNVAQKGPAQKGLPQPDAFPQQDAGHYVAPPANGPIFGESNSIGVEGLSLHIPPLNLALPTLKFPSLFRVRNNARMMTKASEAPHQVGPPASSPVQLMMMPNPEPASSNVPDPPAAASPTQQDSSQKSPVQDNYYKGAAYQQNVGNDIQLREMRRLESQVLRLEQMLSRLEQANSMMQVQADSLAPRLPATQSNSSRRVAQPANHIEPARLPQTSEILQRLPAAY